MFINNIPVPARTLLVFATGGTVTLSQSAQADGFYPVDTNVTMAASGPPGYQIVWGGVDKQNGVFGTVQMVADRYVTLSIKPPPPTPTPTRVLFPWEVPTATPAPTPVPLPTPLPVPTATPVYVGPPVPTPPPTATPLPTATPTPVPPGVPTPTPTPTYTLTTSASPPAGGTVSPSDATTHNGGAQVTVTASPASGYFFSGWSGACSGSGSCVVSMDADKTVTANFIQVFTLTTSASPAEGGTVAPDGSNSYTAGTQVPVTASPAGGYAFSSWSGDCAGSGACMVTMDADKTVTANFQLLPTPTPQPPLLSGRIAFYSNWDGNDEIYVINADGSGQTRLTNDPSVDGYPDWSPDGSKIAWWRDGRIWVMNADGSARTNLTTLDGGRPSWSPDGARIAFESDRDGGSEIYVMNSDGSAQTRLTNNSAYDGRPSWSPDGAKITFESHRDGDEEIYVMNADGSGQTRLTNNSANDEFPSWAPGPSIVFQSARDANWEIYSMNADGSGQTNLTNHPFGDSSASWSPDGKKIVFTSARDGGNVEIYVMNADGSNQTRVTNTPAVEQDPDWGS